MMVKVSYEEVYLLSVYDRTALAVVRNACTKTEAMLASGAAKYHTPTFNKAEKEEVSCSHGRYWCSII